MLIFYKIKRSLISIQISPRVRSRIAFIFAMFLPFGKAGGLQILRCKGFAVDDYSFTLCALALKPSDFCNLEVYFAIPMRLLRIHQE